MAGVEFALLCRLGSARTCQGQSKNPLQVLGNPQLVNAEPQRQLLAHFKRQQRQQAITANNKQSAGGALHKLLQTKHCCWRWRRCWHTRLLLKAAQDAQAPCKRRRRWRRQHA